MQKKILIVTDFYNPHTSGVVTYINQVIYALKKLNFSITILTSLHSKSLKKEEIVEGIKIIRCKPTLKISRGYYSIDLVLNYFKIYRSYDYVNIHFPLTEVFPILFTFNKKTIFNYHCLPSSSVAYKFIDLYFYIFGLISSLMSKKIIVLSKDYFLNIFAHKLLKDKVCEIPPYIVQNKIHKNKKNKSKITIGYLGRICQEKGLENLLEVSKILQINNVAHKIQIGGELNDKRFKKYISNILHKSKNNKNIVFLNKIQENEKINFFNQLDVFVLPSINSFEAFGIVQLEAMSCGIPVVASNIKGVRSIVKKTKNGFLFEKNNSKQLANKIIKIRNFHFKKSEDIASDTLKNYGIEIFLKRISRIFEFV